MDYSKGGGQGTASCRSLTGLLQSHFLCSYFAGIFRGLFKAGMGETLGISSRRRPPGPGASLGDSERNNNQRMEESSWVGKALVLTLHTGAKTE